jgi:hypothetical protein
MKRLFIILVIGLIWGACTEEKVEVYSLTDEYIYIPYNSNLYRADMRLSDSVYMFYNKSALSVHSMQERDTFYFRVLVTGAAKKVDRKIKLESWENEVTGKEAAVPGVNYIAFDDPEMERNLILPADSVGVNIPIIVTYDPVIAGQWKSFVVTFKLAESEDFKVLGTNSDITSGNAARSHAYVQFNQSGM